MFYILYIMLRDLLTFIYIFIHFLYNMSHSSTMCFIRFFCSEFRSIWIICNSYVSKYSFNTYTIIFIYWYLNEYYYFIEKFMHMFVYFFVNNSSYIICISDFRC